jgi:hypothetical protein
VRPKTEIDLSGDKKNRKTSFLNRLEASRNQIGVSKKLFREVHPLTRKGVVDHGLPVVYYLPVDI